MLDLLDFHHTQWKDGVILTNCPTVYMSLYYTAIQHTDSLQ